MDTGGHSGHSGHGRHTYRLPCPHCPCRPPCPQTVGPLQNFLAEKGLLQIE